MTRIENSQAFVALLLTPGSVFCLLVFVLPSRVEVVDDFLVVVVVVVVRRLVALPFATAAACDLVVTMAVISSLPWLDEQK